MTAGFETELLTDRRNFIISVEKVRFSGEAMTDVLP
jgi:hypothetical protein